MISSFFKRPLRFILLLLILLWIGGYAAFVYSITFQVIPQRTGKADAIIVLTGGTNRIQAGLKLFQVGMSENLYITGVHKGTSKADILSMWTEGKALPHCCITLGHKATTTLENALETKTWIKDYTAKNKKINSIYLVTSDYHMPRALLEFKYAMPTLDIFTHTVQGDDIGAETFKFWQITFKEYHKTLFRSVMLKIAHKG